MTARSETLQRVSAGLSPQQPRLRILIVGINYAPEHAGIAPYTTEAAEHWASAGHDVRVITGVDHYPHWTVHDDMRRRLTIREQRNGVDVTRLRHYVPTRQSALRRAAYEATFGLHVAISARWQPDVVVAVVPSLLGAAAAARLARREGASFLLWIQDVMAQAAVQSGIAGGRATARVARAVETWVARRADVVALVSDGFRSHVLDYGVEEARLALMPNWTHVRRPCAHRDDVRRRLGWDDGRIVALHSGNMGLKQGLENVVAAARLGEGNGAPPVRFVLMGDGSQRSMLQALSRGLSSVDIAPPALPADYPDVLHAADVLVVNERPGVVDMSLPSKLTSYFVAGRPVVAATPPDSGTAHEIRRAGAGAVVAPGDPAALLAAVRQWGADSQRADEAGRAAAAYGDAVLTPAVARANLDEILLLAAAAAPRAEAASYG